MTKLIGITGRARSGKDTAATILRVYHGFHRMAFADPLKSAVSTLFKVPADTVFSDAIKELQLPFWDLKFRDILQRFGTESMRDVFGQDFWIRRWLLDYAPIRDSVNVVVTDVRFENEAQTIRDYGGVIIHLHRDEAGLTGSEGRHRSEGGVMQNPYDVIVYNNGTLVELAEKLGGTLAFMEGTT